MITPQTANSSRGRDWRRIFGPFGELLCGFVVTTNLLFHFSYHSFPLVNSYLFIISLEVAQGKNIIRSVDLITKSGPVLYTNLLGFPLMILFARIGGEFECNWPICGPEKVHASQLAAFLRLPCGNCFKSPRETTLCRMMARGMQMISALGRA
jgi:hypothetical protein